MRVASRCSAGKATNASERSDRHRRAFASNVESIERGSETTSKSFRARHAGEPGAPTVRPTRYYASTNRRSRQATYAAVCSKQATLLGNVDRANRKPQCG